MPRDLRSFLDEMERVDPGNIRHVKERVDSKFEVTALLQILEDDGLYPLVVFENVPGLNGKGDYRVVSNLTARRQGLAIAMDLPPEKWRTELVEQLAARADYPRSPALIEASEAPVKEVVERGQGMDLSQFPIVYHHEMDSGPFLTMVAVTKHPEWGVAPGVHNVSFHRSEYVAADHCHLYMAPTHTWNIFRNYEEKGLPCPVALVIGHHPAFYLAANMRPDVRLSEYDVAGALLGEPLRLVASETWGADFLVPADAEIIIEGEILPGVRETEAPFGEWTGYYGPQRLSPAIQVKAITHRRDPFYLDNFIGHRDMTGLCLGWEGTMLKRAREAVPTVLAVCCPPSGCGAYHVYVQLDKKNDGEPINAAIAVISHGHPKLVIVVDKDIDVFNEEKVLWAVATRAQAGRNMQILRGVKGSSLDPSLSGQTLEKDVLIIDATIRVGQPFAEALKVPEDAVRKMRGRNLL